MTGRRKQASGCKSLGALLGGQKQDVLATTPPYFSGGRTTGTLPSRMGAS